MRRRAALAGLLALGGCAAARAPVVVRPSPPSSLRFAADAPFEIWAAHLHLPTMRDAPTILALSGGGEDGAFGAGVLTGWTRAGGRPTFDVVTGVSTGALMAPFAFLGPRYDSVLRSIYTEYGQDDLMRGRGLPGLLGDALNDPSPMADLIARHVTPSMVSEIAGAHAAGRRLFVVTSNLDTGHADVWDLGAMAAAGRVELIRGVTLASASVPGFFPPVRLKVGRGASATTEAHVDGGVNMQVLAVPEAAFRNLERTRKPGGALYVLVNNTLRPNPAPVPRRAVPIMQSTFTTMVRAQAGQSVASARRYAARTGMDFAVASVGPDLAVPFDPSRRFDPAYMRALYAYGWKRAVTGTAWGR